MNTENNPTPSDVFLFYYVPAQYSITEDDPLIIQELIHELPAGDHNIHLILHTLGGDPFAAAKIINILHASFRKVSVIVPYRSMSAGTLLALGGDEIVMPNMAQLGPLDIQVSHPTGDKMMSAFDYTNPVDYLVGLTSTAGSRLFRDIRQSSQYKINSAEAMKIAYQSAVQLFEPVIKQLDPIELSRCSRILEVAKKYGESFLTEYSLVPELKKDKEYASILITHLTYRYPNHTYAIHNREAKSLGLNVIFCEDYPHWQVIWDTISKDIKNDLSPTEGNQKFIKWIEPYNKEEAT